MYTQNKYTHMHVFRYIYIYITQYSANLSADDPPY